MRTLSCFLLAFLFTQTGEIVRAQAQEPSAVAQASNDGKVRGQETLEESLAKMPSWTVLLEASAYRVGASGKVKMPGTTALASTMGQSSLTLEKIGADNPQWAPYGRIRWRPTTGNWSFGVSGFATSIDEQGNSDQTQRVGDMILNPGDSIRTEISFRNIDVEAGYRIFERARGVQENTKATKIAPYLDLTAGVRVLDTDVRFSQTTTTPPPFATGQSFIADKNEVFFQPIVGVRTGLELVEKFNIDVRFNVGGLPGTHRSVSWDIEPCFTWRPWTNVGVHIGYRNLFMSVRTGDYNERYSWRGAMAGLYFGVTGRF